MEDIIQAIIDFFKNVDLTEMLQNVWNHIVDAWDSIRDFVIVVYEWWIENQDKIMGIIQTVKAFYKTVTEVVPEMFLKFKDLFTGENKYIVKRSNPMPVQNVPVFSELDTNKHTVLNEEQLKDVEILLGR